MQMNISERPARICQGLVADASMQTDPERHGSIFSRCHPSLFIPVLSNCPRENAMAPQAHMT